MKKILVFVFILSFSTSCQLSTSKTTITANNVEKDLKAKVTFSGEMNQEICINCNQ